MIPPLVFAFSVVLDYISTHIALGKGLVEGNNVLRNNPLVVGLASAAIIVGGAEIYRAQGASGWEWIYWIGAGLHGLGAIVNIVQIVRKK